jgi:cytochrome b6-f complex subunit 5
MHLKFYFKIVFKKKIVIINSIFYLKKIKFMIEPFLFGIVLGIITVTLSGLFTAAFLQYRRAELIEN